MATHIERIRAYCVRCRGPAKLLTGLALLSFSQAALAQDAPTTEQLLGDIRSPQVSVRALAVAHLSGLPISVIPAEGRSALVALLEMEALGTAPVADPVSDSPDDELWGEYIIDLSDLVVRIGDSRGLRGLSLLGIQTSRSVQDFVARNGVAALPFLEEAWNTKPSSRPSVIQTWTRILLLGDGSGTSSSTRSKLVEVLAGAAHEEPLAIASSARKAVLIPLMPLLIGLEANETDEVIHSEITRALGVLRAKLESSSAPELLGNLYEGVRLFCLGASGARTGACESIQNMAATAKRHAESGRKGPALATLDALASRVDQAVQAGVISPDEANFVHELARYARARY